MLRDWLVTARHGWLDHPQVGITVGSCLACIGAIAIFTYIAYGAERNRFSIGLVREAAEWLCSTGGQAAKGAV